MKLITHIYYKNNTVEADVKVSAFKSVLWGISLILYVRMLAALLKLSICYPFGGKYFMWWAGNVECFDAGQGICIIASIILLFVPYILHRILKKQRVYSDFSSFIFSSLILTYNEECWSYSSVNLFRRTVLIVFAFIPINESVRAILICMTCVTLLFIHCYFMPFKWSLNNHLETIVLSCTFGVSALNIVGSSANTFITIISLIPLIPLPILLYDFFRIFEFRIEDIKTKVPKSNEDEQKYDTVDFVEKEEKLENQEIPETGTTLTTYDTNKSFLNSDEDIAITKISTMDSFAMDTQNYKDQINEKPKRQKLYFSFKLCCSKKQFSIYEREIVKSEFIDEEIIRKTKFGLERKWAIPCVYKYIWHETEKVSISCTIKFSSIPPISNSNKIGKPRLKQILNKYTKDTGAKLSIKNITVKEKTCELHFDCKWNLTDFDLLSPTLKKISIYLAMETKIIEALKNNYLLRKDILTLFNVDEDSSIQIVQFILAGPYKTEMTKQKEKDKDNEVAKIEIKKRQKRKNEKLMRDILRNRELKGSCYKKKAMEIACKPLHRFTSDDIVNVIMNWSVNDVQSIKQLKSLMNFASKEDLSGSICIKLDDKLGLVLEKEVLKYVTRETFDKIIDNFKEEMKTDAEIPTKRSPEIAEMICDYSIGKLEKYIYNNKIDGKMLCDNQDFSWIQNECGWNDDEITQIKMIFLKNQTELEEDIKKKLENNLNSKFDKTISKYFIDNITDLDLDLEVLQLKMKNGKNINNETEKIMKIIDELEKQQDNEMKQEQESTLVQDLYKVVSQSMQCVDPNWVCSDCGCHNFACYYAGDMQVNVAYCRLCGIDQLSSYILSLSGRDTYTMVHDEYDIYEFDDDEIDSNDNDEQDPEAESDISTADNIEMLIMGEDTEELKKVKAFCPNLTGNKQCKSVERLRKHLVFYQQWLNKIRIQKGNTDVKVTINVDIKQLDNKIWCERVIKAAEDLKKGVKEEQMEKLKKALNDNIIDIKQFADLEKKQFLTLLQKHTGIKRAYCSKLYRRVMQITKDEAQAAQFGKFFSSIESNQIEFDFHHLLHVHISNSTSKKIKEDVFRYFQTNIQCDEDGCSSLSRNRQRRNKIFTNSNDKQKPQLQNNYNKDLWTKQQKYVQSTLDLIHSYFVHHDWQHDQTIKDDNYQNEYSQTVTQTVKKSNQVTNIIDMKKSDKAESINKEKYVSNANSIHQYGFGIDHDYRFMSALYSCLRDELLENEEFVQIDVFEDKLVKALRKLAPAHNEYRLKCKHFDPKYAIVRNQLIGIRHLIAIIIYTDCSTLCTHFRSTYRQLTTDKNENAVRKRHQAVYWFARFLFEAIEFFGHEMGNKMYVYHGLNKKMLFERFNAYFCQPVSTTKTFQTAQQFADDAGIILVFKKGMDKSLTPQYLDVSWLSAFPNEDERLFYGDNIVFEITDIIEAKTLTKNGKFLKLLNTFQKLVKNQEIQWLNKRSKKIKEKMIKLIEKQKSAQEFYVQYLNEQKPNTIQIDENKEEQKMEEKTQEQTQKYGEELFKFFCQNKSTDWICIRNFESIPTDLKNVLVNDKYESDNNKKYPISFISLCAIFPNCTKIVLNNLDTKLFTERSNDYIKSVLTFIEYVNKKDNNIKSQLCRIIFESNQQIDSKPDPTLKKWATRFQSKFKQLGWKISYQFRLERYHTLRLKKQKSVKITNQEP